MREGIYGAAVGTRACDEARADTRVRSREEGGWVAASAAGTRAVEEEAGV